MCEKEEVIKIDSEKKLKRAVNDIKHQMEIEIKKAVENRDIFLQKQYDFLLQWEINKCFEDYELKLRYLYYY